MTFSIHPKLKEDCIRIGETSLCQVLLLDDSQFPWLILVPKRENISEIYQLNSSDQTKLACETNGIGQRLMAQLGGDKLNLGALGNVVSQLHIHIIIRFKNDAAWPSPVWGNYNPKPYSTSMKEQRCLEIRELLKEFLLV